ncbi:hypothetical protein EJ03DRAFT_186695 [Teratosphaeria nubilosa]|uniref:Uncharacterized protein n=1 Tax=Teratosphaeria nubilosa TaxID=161662 RepID=A0A6G1LI21_9PEZI|nr:hypothetical protein EJ03DRAFT_186695 [Teratosphaeria nubilosa]
MHTLLFLISLPSSITTHPHHRDIPLALPCAHESIKPRSVARAFPRQVRDGGDRAGVILEPAQRVELSEGGARKRRDCCYTEAQDTFVLYIIPTYLPTYLPFVADCTLLE